MTQFNRIDSYKLETADKVWTIDTTASAMSRQSVVSKHGKAVAIRATEAGAMAYVEQQVKHADKQVTV